MKKTFLVLIFIVASLLLLSCGNVPDNYVEESEFLGTVTEITSETKEKNTKKATSPRPKPTQPALDNNDDIQGEGMKREYKAMNFENMKCMWLSQFDLSRVYCDGGTQRREADFRRYMSAILDNVVLNGMNTVFLQVRPNADSMYPSEVYPPSAYVVGEYGNNFSYDAVSIVVELAKEKNLSVHAWINPLRVMSDEKITMIPHNYTIRRWYDDIELRGKYLVKIGNNWYLNPAYADVRTLILDGACELMQKYEFDGLHMDDYFYPTTDTSFDSYAYSQYLRSGGDLSLEDFRRDSLNKLISAMYSIVKSVDDSALYGISPAGNYNTVYNAHYADIYTWCSSDGYIDYICPQVYFGLEHSSFDFVNTSKIWQGYIKSDSVKLVIGMSLGKAISGSDNYAGAGKNEWSEHKDVLKRCLMNTQTLEKCIGVSYFCYQYFYDPITGESNAATQEERDNFIPLLKECTWSGLIN